jgi:hypothetical protein
MAKPTTPVKRSTNRTVFDHSDFGDTPKHRPRKREANPYEDDGLFDDSLYEEWN